MAKVVSFETVDYGDSELTELALDCAGARQDGAQGPREDPSVSAVSL